MSDDIDWEEYAALFHDRRKYNSDGDERPFYSPFRWTLFWRRLFFITLPISVPLWLLCMTVGVICLLVFMMIASPFLVLWFLWEELWEKKPGD